MIGWEIKFSYDLGTLNSELSCLFVTEDKNRVAGRPPYLLCRTQCLHLLSYEILYLEVGDSTLEVTRLLQGEEEGGDVVV